MNNMINPLNCHQLVQRCYCLWLCIHT